MSEQTSLSIDRIRYELLWLMGMFSIMLISCGADSKVTGAAIVTFTTYAAILISGKISAWWTKPDEPAAIERS